MPRFVVIENGTERTAINLSQVVAATWSDDRQRVCLWTSLWGQRFDQHKDYGSLDDPPELAFDGTYAEQIISAIEGTAR